MYAYVLNAERSPHIPLHNCWAIETDLKIQQMQDCWGSIDTLMIVRFTHIE